MTRGLDEVNLTPPTVEINDAIFHRFVNGSPEVALKELERQINRGFRQLTEDLNNALKQISEQTTVEYRRSSEREKGAVRKG